MDRSEILTAVTESAVELLKVEPSQVTEAATFGDDLGIAPARVDGERACANGKPVREVPIEADRAVVLDNSNEPAIAVAAYGPDGLAFVDRGELDRAARSTTIDDLHVGGQLEATVVPRVVALDGRSTTDGEADGECGLAPDPGPWFARFHRMRIILASRSLFRERKRRASTGSYAAPTPRGAPTLAGASRLRAEIGAKPQTPIGSTSSAQRRSHRWSHLRLPTRGVAVARDGTKRDELLEGSRADDR